MKTSKPRRFLTLRERDGSHRRSKSADPNQKARPLSSEAFFSIFKRDSAGHVAKEEDEKSTEATKVDTIAKRLAEQHYGHISKEHIRYALATRYADGSAEKAVDLLQVQQQSFSGIIAPYNPNTHMVGAENRGNVTCYLDSLLFAMFAKLDAFDCMLKNDLQEEPQRKLAALIRLWVNMLRTGKLIHTDMTQHLQDALADCGWRDARELEQQDTSEAFAFITETLQLPLLTLQVDLFHQGKGDADDHKVVYERLLNLAVPPDPAGKGLRLEDCLEDYFNTQVDVLRDSLDEKKGSVDLSTKGERSTIRVVTEKDDGGAGPVDHEQDPYHGGAVPMKRRWTVQSPEGSQTMLAAPSRPETRHRSTSIIQRIELVEERQATDGEVANLVRKAKRTGSTVVMAVTIPAWQFFKLIPWHSTSDDKEPSNDLEVARQLSQRPVVGICLKRYMWTESGLPQRQNTFIDIPDSMRLPHFMMVDDKKVEESPGLSAEYKLVLQSVVCHRGDSLHSGHYVSFARVAPKLLTDNRRHNFDPPPDYEEAQWVKFDDLHIDSRVSYVDNIKQALAEEMPYLLFYQIVPLVDITTASTDGSVAAEPPAYTDSATTVVAPPTTSLDDWQMISRSTSGYFESATNISSSGHPSIRLSSEYDRPSRLSLEDEQLSARHVLAAVADRSRRGSLALADSPAATPAITPEGGPSPLIPQGEGASAAERTAERLSRAAARFTKVGSRSRPASQAGEGRTSAGVMTRLGLVRSSKEPLREDSRASEVSQVSQASQSHQAVEAEAVAEEPSALEERDGHRHHHHHLHSQHRKERSRGRRSGVAGSEKDTGKGREMDSPEKSGEKGKGKAELPERECVLM